MNDLTLRERWDVFKLRLIGKHHQLSAEGLERKDESLKVLDGVLNQSDDVLDFEEFRMQLHRLADESKRKRIIREHQF